MPGDQHHKPGDHYEPNRVLGFPVRPGPWPAASRPAPGEEPQRVAGLPVDWFTAGWFTEASQGLRGWLRRLGSSRARGPR